MKGGLPITFRINNEAVGRRLTQDDDDDDDDDDAGDDGDGGDKNKNHKLDRALLSSHLSSVFNLNSLTTTPPLPSSLFSMHTNFTKISSHETQHWNVWQLFQDISRLKEKILKLISVM